MFDVKNVILCVVLKYCWLFLLKFKLQRNMNTEMMVLDSRLSKKVFSLLNMNMNLLFV